MLALRNLYIPIDIQFNNSYKYIIKNNQRITIAINNVSNNIHSRKYQSTVKNTNSTDKPQILQKVAKNLTCTDAVTKKLLNLPKRIIKSHLK